ncbi:CidA/LrgA family protein [Lachnoanaerobaculum umeaense]|uniref:CidA/LrgA family protein n=1 Tax=Lachnoanaerobaculum umeaense TaxID=617123 RepID=A0A385Q2M2_9FIRM|nr:CidA/LrgA family protein [Lachnoanaerobaculum umeaense]AYA99864.1 CidA/LrgA family protein [Lachnoanaerobaculum umeaense]PZW96850.1 holin-like protein [Lachnoanaerobaculum umeaense]
MRFIRQFLIILLVSFLGEVLKAILPLPIPASIYGLVIMLALLVSNVVKLEHVEGASMFLIDIMPLMFIPASAGLIDIWPNLKPVLLPIVIITLVSTILVMVVSGKVTEFVIKLSEDKKKVESDR